ncbi:MAG: GNAT family N-acetyltransferase, partial [Candidatus Krumholzibacteria bacterium]|nr:GNAT family N-acetyltransferase [Candidatus Krumholzibacteria bacterium]
MQIQISDSYTSEMDEIAAGCEGATFYHSRVWAESLSATFPRMIFRCLVARRDRTAAGFFPFFLIRRGPFKTAWSMPFGTYGGPVAEEKDCAVALRQAYGGFTSTAGLVNAGWIDFDGAAGDPDWDRQTADTHLIDLTGGFDKLWEESIEKQRKKRTRRAEKLGVTVRRMNSDDDLRTYYKIYSCRLKEWGEKTKYPLKLFEELLKRGGDTVRLYMAEHEGEIVGGHFNFYSRNMVTAWNGVTTPES